MLWTLQGYILREMGKVFVLTATGLTALISLGGGVLNMIELEQVRALDLFKVMSLVLPMGAAIALPVAALFSATITYGRLSADNELVACRASGINIHHLLLSALTIGLISSAIGFWCFNYVMPSVLRGLDRFVRTNLDQIVQHALTSPGRLPLVGDRYRLYADRATVLRGATTNGVTPEDCVVLGGVAFAEMSKGDWVRYGTAERVDLRFHMASRTPTAQADMYNLSLYDRRRKQFVDDEHIEILPYELPARFPLKLKWLDLSELLRYRGHPEELPEVVEGLRALRSRIAESLFHDWFAQAWRDGNGQRVEMGDASVSLTLRSGNLRLDEEDGRPSLFEGVTVLERAHGRVRTVTGAEAAIDVARSSEHPMGRVTVQVTGGVRITAPSHPGRVIERPRERLESFPLPSEFVSRAMAYPDRGLLSSGAQFGLGTAVDRGQSQVVDGFAKVQCKVAKEIHSRLALSVSTLALVILGAALGIALRGSHFLTAFGISAVPTLVLIGLIVAGRQMAEKPATALVGLGVMWGGIAAVGALDAWALARLVRR